MYVCFLVDWLVVGIWKKVIRRLYNPKHSNEKGKRDKVGKFYKEKFKIECVSVCVMENYTEILTFNVYGRHFKVISKLFDSI